MHKEELVAKLAEKLRGVRKLAVLGVGNELRGDDAVGPLLARRIKRLRSPKLMIIDCGVAPENYTGILRRFRPSHVVVVDAVDTGSPPGTVEVFESCELVGLPLSTHKVPLRLLAEYLEAALKCKLLVLGIQPGTLGFTDRPSLSREVEEGLRLAEEALVGALSRLNLLCA